MIIKTELNWKKTKKNIETVVKGSWEESSWLITHISKRGKHSSVGERSVDEVRNAQRLTNKWWNNKKEKSGL